MGNKEDWEELEKWQKEYDSKKEEELKVDIKQFKPKDTKKAKIFSLLINLTSRSMFSILAIFFTLVVLGVCIWFYGQVERYLPRDVVKELENRYKGEKFEIIEDYSETTEHGRQRGLYIISPKNNKNIKFNAFCRGANMMDDYSERKFKYYVESYPDKEFLKEFEIEEKTESDEIYGNAEFLKYKVCINVNDYDEIEEKTVKLYKLANYIRNQNDKIYDNISLINRDIKYWLPISSNTNDLLEDIMKNAKYQYINILKETNNVVELNKIGNQEIEDMWKPDKLLLYINDKQMKLYNDFDAVVYYDIKNRSYYMSGLDVIFKQIEPIEVLKQGIFSGNVKKIKYNNKVYKVSSSSEGKKDDVIYSMEIVENFCKKFNTIPEYDYENKKVYITIK